MFKKLKIAILGTGKIGTDLLIKTLRSDKLKCSAFIGRASSSPSILKARQLGISTSDEGIEYIINHPDCCDLVFDATSAKAHLVHAPHLAKLSKLTIDLTPAGFGAMCVPGINLNECLQYTNVNLVTCGGQAALPVVYVISKIHTDIDYIEVVSSVASRSAGPATRLNLDEYIHTTEAAIKYFSGTRRCKAIVNMNPAIPCIDMQTTILAKVSHPDMNRLDDELAFMIGKIKAYVPGYELLVGPLVHDGLIFITVRVKGTGDYLPDYAGNLDIMNCAAVATAEAFADNRMSLNYSPRDMANNG